MPHSPSPHRRHHHTPRTRPTPKNHSCVTLFKQQHHRSCLHYVTLCGSNGDSTGRQTYHTHRGKASAKLIKVLSCISHCAPSYIADYIKIDGCRGAQDENTSWSRFHQGLTECYQNTGKEIVQSVESCDTPDTCGQWVSKVANLWRTGGDVSSSAVGVGVVVCMCCNVAVVRCAHLVHQSGPPRG